MQHSSKLLAVSALILFPILAFYLGTRFAQMKPSVPVPVPTPTTTTNLPVLSMEDREKNYFREEIFPKYPNLTSEIDPTKIMRVYPIALKYISDGGTGYVVQVDNDVNSYSFYLITPLVQKKLEHPMTGYHGEDARCTVLQVLPVERAEYLARPPYAKNTSYFLISGNQCNTYGGGEFTSMYELKTGEKIKFSRPPIASKLYVPEVNDVGNINGTLDGVYGNPMTIAVQTHYNGYDISFLFFDFLTGRFKQAVRL